jgi:osmotically-inducible protein OsmY
MTMFHTISASNSVECARLKGLRLTQNISALIGGLILMSALSGCATFEKCGFKGCPGDAQITAEVKALLDGHPELGTSISVRTLDHVVYLYGLVDTPLGSEIAESVAREAPGVTRVVSSITYGNT